MNKSDIRIMINRILDGDLIEEDLNNAIDNIKPDADESIIIALHEMQHYIADKDLRINDLEYDLLLKESLLKLMNDLR